MKTFLILGASSDVGMAYMERLASRYKPDEARIIAHYRAMSPKLEEMLHPAGQAPIDAMQADLLYPEQVAGLIGQIKEKYTAPTHILHLAAGKFRHMRLRDFDSSLISDEMQIQVLSLGEIFKAFLPVMAKNRYGKVAVMLTAYTIGVPPKFMTDYIVCKYALLGLMKAAAAEYCDKGLCINGISPAMMETKFLEQIDPRIVEMTAAETPLKRNMYIAEVLGAIDFLLSDENAYMCGATLNLSGGGRA